MRWWPRRKRHTNGAAAAAAESTAKLVDAEKMTPLYERMAPHLASLPKDEFADRVVKAFGARRHA